MQLLGQSFWLFVQSSANVKSFGFEEQSFFLEDSIGEIEADAFHGGQPGFDGEPIVVARGRFIAEVTFDDGKDDVLLLPFEEG